MGHAVVQLVDVLRYKPKGRGFDSNNVLREMRGNRYTTASTDCLRGRTSDMDLDKTRIAAILRIHPTHIPGEWTLRPTFHQFPPPPQKKRAAIIWIVAHLVAYCIQTQRRFSLNECMDFLLRARWKECH
jgi:hypothetical protein